MLIDKEFDDLVKHLDSLPMFQMIDTLEKAVEELKNK